jgi:hypothetical protein
LFLSVCKSVLFIWTEFMVRWVILES